MLCLIVINRKINIYQIIPLLCKHQPEFALFVNTNILKILNINKIYYKFKINKNQNIRCLIVIHKENNLIKKS